jgi:hypothetical protein
MWRRKQSRISLALWMLVACTGCRSPYYADQGAALGGIAGGLAGAAIGDHNDNALGGALLGGAVGALSGAVIGDSMDAEVARRQAAIEAKMGRRMAGAVTVADVTSMVSAGLSDDLIVNHVQANGVAAPLTPNDIIRMHDNGVSENVINSMQQTSARQVAAAPVAYPAPVIVEEVYMPPPYYYARPYCAGPPHRYYRRPGVSWGFSYAH